MLDYYGPHISPQFDNTSRSPDLNSLDPSRPNPLDKGIVGRDNGGIFELYPIK